MGLVLASQGGKMLRKRDGQTDPVNPSHVHMYPDTVL